MPGQRDEVVVGGDGRADGGAAVGGDVQGEGLPAQAVGYRLREQRVVLQNQDPHAPMVPGVGIRAP